MPKRPEIVFPPPLSAQSTVRVVAASSPFDWERCLSGIEVLQETGLNVRYDESALRKSARYLAGEDAHRLEQLKQALSENDTEAIFFVRGGYGLTRLLPSLSRDDLLEKPKWLAGFSDVTAVSALAFRHGLGSIHGPLVTTLAKAGDREKKQLFHLLLTPQAEWRGYKLLDDLQPITRPRNQDGFKGRLFAGNIALLASMCGSPYVPDFSGCILGLEEIGEAPYRIDRMLHQLNQAGLFNGVRAVILGRFTNCNAPLDSDYDVWDVLRDIFTGLKLPVFRSDGFGHGGVNLALPNGADVKINDGALTVE